MSRPMTDAEKSYFKLAEKCYERRVGQYGYNSENSKQRYIEGFFDALKQRFNYTTISDAPQSCKFCENYEFVKSLHKPGIDKSDGSKITYRYTATYVDEVLVNRKSRARTLHYTWKKLNFCPVCGKKLQ